MNKLQKLFENWNPLYDDPPAANPGAKYSDFPIEANVKVLCDNQDFHFFYGETGKVIKNNMKGNIIVKFDKPRKIIYKESRYFGGTSLLIQESFNFKPYDLEKL